MKLSHWLIVAVVLAGLVALFTPSVVSYEQVEVPVVQEVKKVSVSSLAQEIVETARLFGIDEGRFLATAKCESSLNPSAIGDDGESIGIFQIHLPSHPSVTKELALNASWAIKWAAEKFRADPRIWVCYKKLYE